MVKFEGPPTPRGRQGGGCGEGNLSVSQRYSKLSERGVRKNEAAPSLEAIIKLATRSDSPPSSFVWVSWATATIEPLTET